MTGPATGEPDRGTREPPRRTRLEAARALSVTSSRLGLALRLIIAYVLLPGSGLRLDLEHVPGSGQTTSPQHGPLRLLRPRLLRRLHARLPLRPVAAWASSGSALGGLGDLIKLPAILADLGPGLARLVDGPRARWLATGGAARRRALPLQPDHLVRQRRSGARSTRSASSSCCSACATLWRDRPERAALFAVVAAIIKPQLGILIPIVAVVLLRRTSSPGATSGAARGRRRPDRPVRAGPSGEPWLTRLRQGPVRLVTSAAVGLATAIAAVRCRSACRRSTCSRSSPRRPAATRTSRSTPTTRGRCCPRTATAWPRTASATRSGTWPARSRTRPPRSSPDPALYVGTALLVVAIVAVCAIVAMYPRRWRWSWPRARWSGPALVDDRRCSSWP